MYSSGIMCSFTDDVFMGGDVMEFVGFKVSVVILIVKSTRCMG